MLSSFRRLSKSAVGTAIFVVFLLTILASFAIGDLNSIRNGGFGSGTGGGLAKVGDEKITDRDVSEAAKRALTSLRAQNPEADYSALAPQFNLIIDQLLNDAALQAFSTDHGFVLSKRLIDAEIAKLPEAKGLDGKFSEQAYQAFLQSQQLTDADARKLIRNALTQRLILAPAAVNYKVPLNVARPYASMLLETRQGQLALIPIESFAAGLNPSDGDLQTYYAQNKPRYMVAEQRVLKFARITPETVKAAAPTDAEIAAYYKANQATYAGNETRVISQAVVQDKAAADGIASRARAGTAFAAAAAPAGLSAEDVSVGPQSKAQFQTLAGAAAANAAFSAPSGGVVGPIKSDLGWHVIKIDSIRNAEGKSLAQARGEIVAKLAEDKRKTALSDAVTKVQDAIDDGSSFAEAAAAANLQVVSTPLITGAGVSRKDPGFQLPADLQPALKTGFQLAGGDDPDVVTLDKDAGYVLVGVDTIQEAAPAPLADVKDRVRVDWIKAKASDRARAIATQIATAVAKGQPMDQAIAATKAKIPPAQPISARRIQISQANADAATPLKMLFALAKGKSRMVADPQGRGFFVVKTDAIIPGDANNNPTLIAQTAAAFQQASSDELVQQFLSAMKADQGVHRDEALIKATKDRITGAGSAAGN